MIEISKKVKEDDAIKGRAENLKNNGKKLIKPIINACKIVYFDFCIVYIIINKRTVDMDVTNKSHDVA